MSLRGLLWSIGVVIAVAILASAAIILTSSDRGASDPPADSNYPGVKSFCDNGNRVYVTGKSMQGAGSAIAVVAADPTCGGA